MSGCVEEVVDSISQDRKHPVKLRSGQEESAVRYVTRKYRPLLIIQHRKKEGVIMSDSRKP